MSPICPRCGGELKEVVIFAWKHTYADQEESCGGKDGPRQPGKEDSYGRAASESSGAANNRPVPANPAQASRERIPPTPAPGVLYQCRQCGQFKAPWQGALCKPCWSLEEEKVEERERTLRGYERS